MNGMNVTFTEATLIFALGRTAWETLKKYRGGKSHSNGEDSEKAVWKRGHLTRICRAGRL